MEQSLINIATLFWPELKSRPYARMLVGAGDVITSIYCTIIYLIGVVWLIAETDLTIIRENWQMMLLFAVLIELFTRIYFFMIIEFRSDRYGSADGAFNSMMLWTAILLFGPSSLWIMFALRIFEFIKANRGISRKATLWNNYRSISLTLAGFTLPYLVGWKVYLFYNGEFPLTNLVTSNVIAGFMGILSNFIVFLIIWIPYFLYAIYTQKKLSDENESLRPVALFFLLALTLPVIAHPFAIIAAGLYSLNGLFIFLFFMFGLLVVAYLARKFSLISESHRQQSKQLENLEKLGRAILNSYPEISDLSSILKDFIPAMFPSSAIVIWSNLEETIYLSPIDWEPDLNSIQDWISSKSQTRGFLSHEQLPWDLSNKKNGHRPAICAPIISQEGDKVIGGIYLELRTLVQPWDQRSLSGLFPGIQALADQISSAVFQAEEYSNSLALQRVSQELQIAGQIQASFLPNQFPKIPGWQLAVTLEPAGGLSGDFFDFIPLSRNRLGIIVADVADKGLGAALYMAMSRTLIRTYAFEYPSRPDIVFSEANDRILMDARANLFITCFYGVLDPENSTLTYCNAGHNPPYLVSPKNGTKPLALERTGMPIGIEEDSTWIRKNLEFKPGEKLILYTDGITEAQNESGEFFEEDNLIEVVTNNIDKSAYQIQNSILKKIRNFIGEAPQYDDITLMVLARDE